MIHCWKCGAEVCRVDVESVYREAMALVREGRNKLPLKDVVGISLDVVAELSRQLQEFDTTADEQKRREDHNG